MQQYVMQYLKHCVTHIHNPKIGIQTMHSVETTLLMPKIHSLTNQRYPWFILLDFLHFFTSDKHGHSIDNDMKVD